MPAPPSPGFFNRMFVLLVGGKAWRFQALCFGPSSTPEVFARVMLLCPISFSSQECGFALSGRLVTFALSRENLLDKGQVLCLCRDLGVGFHGCGCGCHAPVMGFFCVLVRFSAICLYSSGACSYAVLSGLCPLPMVTPSLATACRTLRFFLFLPRASTSCLPTFQWFAWASSFFSWWFCGLGMRDLGLL